MNESSLLLEGELSSWDPLENAEDTGDLDSGLLNRFRDLMRLAWQSGSTDESLKPNVLQLTDAISRHSAGSGESAGSIASRLDSYVSPPKGCVVARSNRVTRHFRMTMSGVFVFGDQYLDRKKS